MGVDGQLALTRYRVTVEALEPVALPTYLGSTLRGAFGHAFRALCRPARAGEPCPLPASCPYHLVFETAPPPAGRREYPPGSEVAFDLTLVGRTRDFFPHFVVTLREVDGLGRTRYSARQDRRMEWGGLVGAATYAGDLTPFWPYLVFGQWVHHVGKGATFGLGGDRLEPTAAMEASWG